MTVSDDQAADKNSSHMLESDRSRQNSQQYNAQLRRDAVNPSDYPEQDRKAADLARDNG